MPHQGNGVGFMAGGVHLALARPGRGTRGPAEAQRAMHLRRCIARFFSALIGRTFSDVQLLSDEWSILRCEPLPLQA